jgi:hypothetical protein
LAIGLVNLQQVEGISEVGPFWRTVRHHALTKIQNFLGIAENKQAFVVKLAEGKFRFPEQ